MRLQALLPALLLFAAPPAGADADALQCGEYRGADGGMALVFTTPSSGYRHDDGSEPQPLWVDRSAAQTRLVMLDDGVAEPIRISADGQRIEDEGVVVYTLRQPRTCATEPSARRTAAAAPPAATALRSCPPPLPARPSARAARALARAARRCCDNCAMAMPQPLVTPAPPSSSARPPAANTRPSMTRRPARR